MQEIYSSFKPLAEQKSLRYHLHLSDPALISYADGEALIKMVSNLLSNAVKYADTIIDVGLSVQQSTHSFIITIKNDGQMIPVDMREKIFEPFVRLKKNEKQKGTGIGLALVRSLTELHGGSVVVKDHDWLNVFELTLPIYTEQSVQKNSSLFQQKEGEKIVS